MKSLLTIGCLSILFLTSGCRKCELSTTTDLATVNFFDFNPFSSYYGVPVINFQFTQTRNEYDNLDCGSDEVSSDLVLYNNIGQSLSFDFNINFFGKNSGSLIWNYQGVATVPAHGQVNLGTISYSPVYLHAGIIEVQSVAIQYF